MSKKALGKGRIVDGKPHFELEDGTLLTLQQMVDYKAGKLTLPLPTRAVEGEKVKKKTGKVVPLREEIGTSSAMPEWGKALPTDEEVDLKPLFKDEKKEWATIELPRRRKSKNKIKMLSRLNAEMALAQIRKGMKKK